MPHGYFMKPDHKLDREESGYDEDMRERKELRVITDLE